MEPVGTDGPALDTGSADDDDSIASEESFNASEDDSGVFDDSEEDDFAEESEDVLVDVAEFSVGFDSMDEEDSVSLRKSSLGAVGSVHPIKESGSATLNATEPAIFGKLNFILFSFLQQNIQIF